jgi:hypothetical protein
MSKKQKRNIEEVGFEFTKIFSSESIHRWAGRYRKFSLKLVMTVSRFLEKIYKLLKIYLVKT